MTYLKSKNKFSNPVKELSNVFNYIQIISVGNRIKILHLKSFDTLHRCIVIESETLEELHAEFGKCFEIGLLYLPRARKISLETSIWAGCFYHAQNGELKKIVSQVSNRVNLILPLPTKWDFLD